MPILAIYLLVAIGVATAGYFGIEAIKDSGRNEIRAEQQAASEAAAKAAREKHDETVVAIGKIEAADEKVATEDTAQREVLKDERKGDGDSDRVVFDERWAAWVRGEKSAVRPRP